MGYIRFWELFKKGNTNIGVDRADLFKDGDNSATNKDIWSYLLDILSIFEASGTQKHIVLGYTLPYIYAVYPKMMEQKLNSINPFGFMGGGETTTTSTDNETPQSKENGSNGKLTDKGVLDFFSGML